MYFNATSDLHFSVREKDETNVKNFEEIYYSKCSTDN